MQQLFNPKKWCLLLGLALLYTGCAFHPQLPQTPTPIISVAHPQVQDISITKSYPGYLTSEQTVVLVGRVNGMLQSIHFKAGEKVKKGQLLFVIEPSIYKDNLLQAQAALKQAEAQKDYATSSYDRMVEAAQSNAISEIQVLQAAANKDESLAAVKNARAKINSVETELSYCYIRAPFDGVIDRNQIDVGNYINGAMQPVKLATIYKNNRMYLYFNRAEDIPFSDPKQTLQIQIGDDSSMIYNGRIDYQSPNIEKSTGTGSLRAVIENPDLRLQSGQYVIVKLPTSKTIGAVLINETAIGTDQLGKYVFLVNDSNIVKYQHIVTGELIADSLRQIISGITPQDRYVTKALLKVKNNMPVKILKP